MLERAAQLDSLLTMAAIRDPGRPALAFDDRVLTYEALDAAVAAVSRRLVAMLGGGAGARVAVIAPNAPALVIGLFATWRAGGVAVPLSARLREYDIAGRLEDAEAAAVLAVSAHGGYSFSDLLGNLLPRLGALRGCVFVDEVGKVQGETRRDGPATRPGPLDREIAAILYTSGSTGAPKGALVHHARELEAAAALTEILALTPDDRTALVVPASHAFGLSCLLAAVASGGLTVLVDSALSSAPLLQAMRRHAATVLHGSPAVFAGLLNSGPDAMAGTRTGLVAGAPSPPGLIESLDRADARILNCYGMTEIGAAACCRSDDPPAARYGTAGRPLPGHEFRTAPADGEDVSLHEFQVRGSHVTSGYHRHPELTAEAFDGDWFRTGDLGFLDADGRVVIAGRAKEVVHVGGFSVFPAEVENFLLTHPDVAQAAVIGVPHPRMGEAVKAFVVPREGSELRPAALLQFARPRIAGYKIPYAIDVVGELPLLLSGKPDREALKSGAASLPLASGGV